MNRLIPLLFVPVLSIVLVAATYATQTPVDSIALPEMMTIPSGEFIRGSNEDDESDEYPQHTVSVSSFQLSRFEVTFEQYDVFAQATNREKPNDEGWGRGSRPVINISWQDAQAYIKWLNRQTGKHFRLPTEAEWEYAARAGASTPYSWGEEGSCEYADYAFTRCNSEGTSAVGSYAPNAYGLYDMHGNVSELVVDCFNGSYRNAPISGEAWMKGDCGERGLRGGAWYDNEESLQVNYRASTAVDDTDDGDGFRLAEDL